jgi:hypothetical protein
MPKNRKTINGKIIQDKIIGSSADETLTGKLLIWNSGLPSLLAQMALQAGVSLLPLFGV